MSKHLQEFIREDKEVLAKLWQNNQDILGHSRRLKKDLDRCVIVKTHPIGEEMLRTLEVLIDRHEEKVEKLEERLDEYEEILDE